MAAAVAAEVAREELTVWRGGCVMLSGCLRTLLPTMAWHDGHERVFCAENPCGGAGGLSCGSVSSTKAVYTSTIVVACSIIVV